MATQPHHPWGCWIFAGHAARSRSNSLVISTTEQHAALPYQGSGHWRPKMQSASMMRAMRSSQTVQEMAWNGIKGLALDQQAAPSIVKLTVAHGCSGSGSSGATDGTVPSPPLGRPCLSDSSASVIF